MYVPVAQDDLTPASLRLLVRSTPAASVMSAVTASPATFIPPAS
jgi:hypothetical protein